MSHQSAAFNWLAGPLLPGIAMSYERFMDKKQIRKALLWPPGAVGATVGFFAIWDGPRAWIGHKATELLDAMTNPLLTMALTLVATVYILATLWTFFELRPVPVDHLAAREADKAKELDRRRLRMIREARTLVSLHEGGIHSDWRSTIRTSPAYIAIRPHLSPEYLKRVQAIGTVELSFSIHEPLVGGFLDEIDRLEKEWGLA
jgi:fumarate reductase subunit C